MKTLIINNREDFANWAIERANTIVSEQGSELATAARGEDQAQLRSAANALGQAIVDTLLDAFDSLTDDE